MRLPLDSFAALRHIDWTRWTVVLLKPDCLQRGLVADVLAWVSREVDIVTHQQVTVTEAQIFAHYDDLLDKPERFHPVDVAADLRRCYVGNTVVVALGRGRPGTANTPARVRALLGHYDPARAGPDTIRGHFGVDSLPWARAEGRLIDNLIHTSDDSEAACRDFVIWFGVDRIGLLTEPVSPAIGGTP